MSTKKNDASSNIVYAIVGGAVCCYFMPSYIPIAICGGGLIICTYGIISVLKNGESVEAFNYVEKEKVEYFKNK